MRFEDQPIEAVGDLVETIRANRQDREILWYRGQGDIEWQLTPSLLRDPGGLDTEMTLFKRFKQNAVNFAGQGNKTEWEWLFLMQHYGVPTRLLDWTESPLVGLYFAVTDDSEESTDSALWCISPTNLNVGAGVEPDFQPDLPSFDIDNVLDNYMPSRLAQETMTRLQPIAANASRNSPRLFAQRGVFTISHRDPTPVEATGDGNHAWRYIIKPESKERIRQELQLLRIDKLSLFPELPSVADSIKEDLS